MRKEIRSLFFAASGILSFLPDIPTRDLVQLAPAPTSLPTPTRSSDIVLPTPAPSAIPEKPISVQELMALVTGRMAQIKSLEIKVRHPDSDRYYDGTTIYQIDIPSQKRTKVSNYPKRKVGLGILEGVTEEVVTVGDHEWSRTNERIQDSLGSIGNAGQWRSYSRQATDDEISWDPIRLAVLISDAKIKEEVKEEQYGAKTCALITAERLQKSILPNADIYLLVDPDTLLIRQVRVVSYEVQFASGQQRIKIKTVTNYEFNRFGADFGIKPPQ